MTLVKITHDEWLEKFKPVQNTVTDRAEFDGTMFETYDADLAHVREVAKTKPLNVWTMLDCDGDLYVANGYHLVNRLGYFITEVSAEANEEYEILID